jgi:hypothetical protein
LIRDQSGDMLLSLQFIREHVSGKERIKMIDAGILHRTADHACPKLCQRAYRGFLDRNLAYPHNADRSHEILLDVVALISRA